MVWKFSLPAAALALALVASAGCGGPSSDDVVKEFDELIAQTATDESVEEANAFLRDNLKRVDEDKAGEMLLAWEAYALNYDNTSVDYEALVDEYAGEIPQYMIELFQFKDLEQTSPIISGAALQIPWPELLGRASAIEDFIAENRDVAMIREDALWLYRRHLNAILMGASNSPIFDYSTHKFSEEARALYEGYVEERPGTTLAWMLSEYRRYLESLDYVFLYDSKDSNEFFDTCNRLVSEAEKRVYRSNGEG
jgi:hypothetical protein